MVRTWDSAVEQHESINKVSNRYKYRIGDIVKFFNFNEKIRKFDGLFHPGLKPLRQLVWKGIKIHFQSRS